MDRMVLEYLIWTGAAYGIQALFAGLQLAICGWLVASGYFLVSPASKEHPRLNKFGVKTPSEKNVVLGRVLIGVGVALLLPLIPGVPFWISLAATAISFGLIMIVNKQDDIKVGRLARMTLASFAIVVFGLTSWEGRDLVEAAATASVSAAYWRIYEKGVQAEYNPATPKAGDMAPDFEVENLEGTKTVHLSDFKGKPVAIVFGSHT